MKTVVFLLRVDSVNDKPEGEYYEAKEGVINCNFWSSPKLIDHQVVIATGQTAIRKTLDKYSHFNIINSTPEKIHNKINQGEGVERSVATKD